MNRMAMYAAGLAVVLVIVGAVLVLEPWSDGDDGREETPETKLTVDGTEYTWKALEALESKTVSGSTGISLSAIINHSGLGDPDTRQYKLLASDGYFKNVTWDNMEEGIMIKVIDGKEVYLRSVFSSIPKRYNVKGIAEIQVVDTPTLMVGGREYTWEQPFDSMFDEVNIGGFEGIRLSDLVNHTGLADPAGHNYSLLASDGYNKTVNWTSMLTGVLSLDSHRTAFESLPKGYQVKDLVEIRVVPMT